MLAELLLLMTITGAAAQEGAAPKKSSSPIVLLSDQSGKKVAPKAEQERKKAQKKVVPLWDKAQEGYTFYQNLIVTQHPSFQIQGLSFKSNLRYQILSRFTIKERHADGRLIVEQKILAAQLQKADPLTQQLLAPAVAQLPGRIHTITLNKSREVTGFKGKVNQPVFGARNMAAGGGLQMASLLDRDGWKELIQGSFFFPDSSFFEGKKWVKKMHHSWGPLGSWKGAVTYVPAGQKDNIQRIGYVFQMVYQRPAGKRAQLPFQITNAVFQPQQAKGFIYFDPHLGRVVGVEEYFRVRGIITIQLLGQPTAVAMEEEQSFQIRITEENPLQK